MTSGAMPPTGPDHPSSTADERAGEGRRHREKVDELARERIDRAAHDHRRGLVPRPRPAGHQRDQHDETGMRREDQCRSAAAMRTEIADHGFRRAQAQQHRPQTFARIREPDQMRTHDDARATTAAISGSYEFSAARARCVQQA